MTSGSRGGIGRWGGGEVQEKSATVRFPLREWVAIGADGADAEGGVGAAEGAVGDEVIAGAGRRLGLRDGAVLELGGEEVDGELGLGGVGGLRRGVWFPGEAVVGEGEGEGRAGGGEV